MTFHGPGKLETQATTVRNFKASQANYSFQMVPKSDFKGRGQTFLPFFAHSIMGGGGGGSLLMMMVIIIIAHGSLKST